MGDVRGGWHGGRDRPAAAQGGEGRCRWARGRGRLRFLPDGSRCLRAVGERRDADRRRHARRSASSRQIDLGKGMRPMGTVASPDGKFVYVTTGRSRMLLIVDTSTNAVVGSVDAGERPWGVAISADGKSALHGERSFERRLGHRRSRPDASSRRFRSVEARGARCSSTVADHCIPITSEGHA